MKEVQVKRQKIAFLFNSLICLFKFSEPNLLKLR